MLDNPRKELHEICDRIFKRHAGDDEALTRAFRQEMSKTPELEDYIIELGIKQLIRDGYLRGRRNSVNRTPISDDERERRVSEMDRRRKFWDQYALYGHIMLGDATVTDLRESAEKRKTQARTNMARARFELAVADRMGETNKPVSKVLKDSEVRALAEKYHA